jgi:hypothetical protein
MDENRRTHTGNFIIDLFTYINGLFSGKFVPRITREEI